ncbi:hypothetical protein Cgig2_030708 [Carnegiea gigantea]|uniref:lipid IVA 3-deoxy-D-manno-octulosonic acid transferase n=1 Tax=Carnegiea gigantea TaxID=171969 RepID=A0A9Q1GQG2_9CARY|nr:hypothetical protein Cgig2_030708 [Carnegiea gigantea]
MVGPTCQFAPLDVPAAVDAFLGYWKPNAVILLEGELWPNLIMAASESKGSVNLKEGAESTDHHGVDEVIEVECFKKEKEKKTQSKGGLFFHDVLVWITLALINARISERSFQRWSMPAILPLITLMLSKFSLIVPLSMAEAIHFQLLQASPFIVSVSADLKYSVGECATSSAALTGVDDLRIQLMHRSAWIASSIHKGEDEVMLRVHRTLAQIFPTILTIIVPRHPGHGLELALALKKRGLNIAVRSDGSKLTSATNIYVIDTLGELKLFYGMMPIAVIGGSFLPSLAGHNVSEAAAAACAVLTGPHIGHFVPMVSAMQRVNPLSILQVSGELELIETLRDLLSNQINLEARQSAAKEAFLELSSGTVAYVWELLNLFIIREALFEGWCKEPNQAETKLLARKAVVYSSG